jgi:protein SCO1/2
MLHVFPGSSIATRRQCLGGFAAAVFAGLMPSAAFGVELAGIRSDETGPPLGPIEGWRIVYFGYTHCPDVCPTGLQTIGEAIEALGPLGTRITPVFVTVDPDRDTPEVLRHYTTFFHPRLVGVTPSRDQLADMAKAWRIKFARVDDRDGNYLMDHTAAIFLVDPAGAVAARLPHDLAPDRLADKIRTVFLERMR